MYDSGKFNVDNLYENFGHLILYHEADLQALALERSMCSNTNEKYKVWPAYARNLHEINYESVINLVTKCGLYVNDLKGCSMEYFFTFQIQLYKK